LPVYPASLRVADFFLMKFSKKGSLHEEINGMYMTIMITDNDERDRERLSQAIDRIDPEIDIIQARNGEEALQILMSGIQQPDIILMDKNVPLNAGAIILDQIRSRDIPIITY
jgi:CheY-like chemotaxis protein